MGWMAYWIALALHLGAPQADGYAKLTSLKVPEWLAAADRRASAGSESRRKKLEAPQQTPAPYEKLDTLKTY